MDLLRMLAQDPTLTVLGFSALFTLAAAFFTAMTAIATRRMADATKAMATTADRTVALAKQHGVFQLHDIWREVSDIQAEDPDEDDVRVGANALRLTASFWNTEAVDKAILYQDYGTDFKRLYQELEKIQYPLPRQDGSWLFESEVLPQGVKVAYEDMVKNEPRQKKHPR